MGKYDMQLEESLKGIQSAISIIQTQFQYETDWICFQYGSGSITNYGEYLVILRVSSQRNPQHGMNEAELQSYLEEHILTRSLITPNETQFVSMINALVIAKEQLLRNRTEIIQILKDLMQAIRNNQFRRDIGILQYVQPQNPKIALHTLIREDTFAFVFQILELKGHNSVLEMNNLIGSKENIKKIGQSPNYPIEPTDKNQALYSENFTQIINSLEQEKSKLEDMLSQKNEELDTLQIQVKELNEERNRLLEVEHEKYGANQRISELENQIGNMKVKMYDFLEQKKKAETDRDNILDENEVIKGKFASLEQQIQNLTQEKNQLNNEKNDAKIKYEEQIEGLDKILHELEEKYTKLLTEHKENQEKSIYFEQLIGDYKNQTAELQTALKTQQIFQENIVDQIQNIANDMKSPMLKMDKLIESVVKTSKQ